MAGKYLKELPSFNKENFSKFKSDEQSNTASLKPVTYIQTKEVEECTPQVITTDKTNILLRYLRQQLDSKDKGTPQNANVENQETASKRNPSNTSLTDSAKPAKIPRLDPEQDEND